MDIGVALWLCPKKTSQLHEKLTTLLSSLNTLFPHKPPKFEPHITITSNIAINLDDPVQTKDDVSKILSASAVAISSLPQKHSSLVRLGKIDSQRKFFKKLYFQVADDPNLVSFARIIRELFVITPQELELENIRANPDQYTQNLNGVTVKRKKSKRTSYKGSSGSGASSATPAAQNPVDMVKIQQIASSKAADWSINEYSPHLSLVYSELHPIDNALWRTIKTRVLDYLNVEDCDSDDIGLGWDGGVLKLMLCEGDVNDWIELGSVDLH